MGGAWHALGNGWQTRSQTAEVDERGHEGWHLDVGALDERGDELLEGWQAWLTGLGEGVGRRRSRRGGGKILVDGWLAANDLGCFLGEIGDHIVGDGELDEVVESGLVLGEKGGCVRHGEGGRGRRGIAVCW